jgi:hypothetical protein
MLSAAVDYGGMLLFTRSNAASNAFAAKSVSMVRACYVTAMPICLLRCALRATSTT